MIRALPGDQEAIANFLMQHAATSMFPLSNLRRYGMSGGHPRACTCFVDRSGNQITDILTLTDEGIVFPQCPSGNWSAAAAALKGNPIKGVLGDANQVAALRVALGLTQPAQLDAVEPRYTLNLADLQMPATDGFRLVPLSAIARETLIVWRAAYSVESLAVPGEDAVIKAEQDVANYIAADSHRVLLQGDTPVAMTGFNAALPEIVQIGGVYTPPALRSRGYARRAVALHLAQARTSGVKQAVLFAANPAAEKAYQAIGFTRDGSFTIALYEDPQHV